MDWQIGLLVLTTILGTLAAAVKVPFLRRLVIKAHQAVSFGKEAYDQWRAGDALYTVALAEPVKSERLAKALLAYGKERDEAIAAAAALRKP